MLILVFATPRTPSVPNISIVLFSFTCCHLCCLFFCGFLSVLCCHSLCVDASVAVRLLIVTVILTSMVSVRWNAMTPEGSVNVIVLVVDCVILPSTTTEALWFGLSRLSSWGNCNLLSSRIHKYEYREEFPVAVKIIGTVPLTRKKLALELARVLDQFSLLLVSCCVYRLYWAVVGLVCFRSCQESQHLRLLNHLVHDRCCRFHRYSCWYDSFADLIAISNTCAIDLHDNWNFLLS